MLCARAPIWGYLIPTAGTRLWGWLIGGISGGYKLGRTIMDLRELSAFVAVVEEGGMSAASRRLHVSQSALSQTMSALERELGITLLERTSTGVRPT